MAGLGLPIVASAQPLPLHPDTLRRQAAPVDNGLAASATQTITAGGMARTYRVGTTRVREETAPLAWRFTSPHVAARVTASPLAFDALGTRLRGATPVRARLEFIPRAGDTISVHARSGSFPGTLDGAQTLAIGAAGTSVVDLESVVLGIAPQVGGRGRWSFPVGETVLGVIAAVERDLAPPPTGMVVWQGTTFRAGTHVTAFAGEQTVIASADVSYSRADTLGGRNLFPGGGAMTLALSTTGAIGERGTLWFSGDAFFVRPFSNNRNDQPTRLIPQGTFAGATSSLLIDAGALTWTPSVTVLREASSAAVLVQQGTVRTRTALTSGAWTLAGGVSVDIPVGYGITISPEIGGVGGRVRSTLAATTGVVLGRRGRVANFTSSSGFADRVQGGWGGVTIRIRR